MKSRICRCHDTAAVFRRTAIPLVELKAFPYREPTTGPRIGVGGPGTGGFAFFRLFFDVSRTSMSAYPNYLLFDGPRRRIYSVISPILEQAGLALPDMRELSVTEKSIRETSHYDGLSRVILGNDLPKIQTPVRLDHYTEAPAFWNIVTTGELHLHALSGRLNQGEFSPFGWEHGLVASP